MPVAPRTKPYAVQWTVGGLEAADYVETTCPGCGVKVRIGPWQLHLRYPPETMLVTLEPRMRCATCGRVGPQPWCVMRASAPVRALPETPLQEARRRRLEAERDREGQEDDGASPGAS